MAFNINRFATNIRDFGYLDNNSFVVMVQTPPVLANAYLSNQGNPTATASIAQNMSFRIDQVRAPGISLSTADINRYGIGPTQKQPIAAQFQEINISILGDHYCEFWQYWYQWTRAVFQYNGVNGQAPNYTAEYKDQFSSTIVIMICDQFGNIIQKINLFEAFPTALREVPLSWADTTNLMKINVSIAFTEYSIEGSSMQTIRPQPTNMFTGTQRETVSS
jgi:hypothetical protein